MGRRHYNYSNPNWWEEPVATTKKHLRTKQFNFFSWKEGHSGPNYSNCLNCNEVAEKYRQLIFKEATESVDKVVTFRERIIHNATKTVKETEPLPIRRRPLGPNDISAAKILAECKKRAAAKNTWTSYFYRRLYSFKKHSSIIAVPLLVGACILVVTEWNIISNFFTAVWDYFFTKETTQSTSASVTELPCVDSSSIVESKVVEVKTSSWFWPVIGISVGVTVTLFLYYCALK